MITVLRLGRLAYRWAYLLQRRLVEARQADRIGDVLLAVEHPPVVTLGRGGGEEDLKVGRDRLTGLGIGLEFTERGGRATYHGPGQLVFYPIFKLRPGELHGFLWALEEAAIRMLTRYGIGARRDPDHPGVWVGRDKVAAVGLAVSGGVTFHGLAINVDPNLAHFDLIVPCGLADRGVTSMARLLGRLPGLLGVERAFCEELAGVLGREWQVGFQEAPWLVAPAPTGEMVARLEALFRQERLHTVCEEALCPNMGECWGGGTATFMLLGDTCTRHCRFCAVASGRPAAPDPLEPYRVARAAAQLGLRHVVVTSVARDDLPDGGAGQFAATIRAIRQRLPGATVEVLIPDFGGSVRALETVVAARPDILNHNVETVPRLYPVVQPRKDYRRALGVLAYAHRAGLKTKSGIILGMGETRGEVVAVLEELLRVGCDVVTLGQYLQPTDRHLEVAEYIHPVEFEWYREIALALGFREVAAGPLVRSSYRAGELLERISKEVKGHGPERRAGLHERNGAGLPHPPAGAVAGGGGGRLHRADWAAEPQH